MGIFTRKKNAKEAKRNIEEEKFWEEMTKLPCQRKGGHHEWRDFPPILDYSWRGQSGDSVISIKEHYVCIYCHKIETKTLLERTYTGYDQDYFFDVIKELKKEYKELLKPQAIVADMINDAIMVDRQKLKIWDQLHADKYEQEPFEFKIKELKHE